ncbi:hypothetical protein CEQ90_00240 [Lewinellaceae bacterium SD302]|nr:hypothetical protein CEQ90_00240 [Lewinellaceae bacterium SD302]
MLSPSVLFRLAENSCNLPFPLWEWTTFYIVLTNYQSIMPKTILTKGFLRWMFGAALLLLFQGVNAQLSVVLQETDPSCFGLGSGSIVSNVSGGEIPYTYAWSNGETTPFIENLTAGTYSLTVTDANGVQGFATALLEEPPQVTLELSADQLCEEPFVITADGDGGVPPYTYNWSTGDETQSITVPSGTYCVTIVDANLCGTFDCITVEVNPPTVNVIGVDVTCFGGEDGTLTAFPSAGSPPYTFLWSNGSTNQTIDGLTAGTYGVTITDSGGCTASATGTVNQPPQLNVTVTQDGPVCAGDFDITVTAFPSGGTPDYTYLWSTGATTQAISGLGAGTYSVTITDENDCTVVGSTTVIQAPSPDVTISGDDVICGDGNTTDLTATPSDGTPNYQLLWSTGEVTPTITVSQAGTYSVTVTDANGCTDEASIEVTLVNLSVNAVTNDVTCFGFDDGSATLFGTGGTQPYTYMWSTGETTQTISGLEPGTYSFTLTEADNCKASGTVTITEPPLLTVFGVVTNPTCPDEMDGSIDVTANGGTPPYTYLWNTGATTQDLENLGTGAYAITVTDDNGCTADATFTIIAPDEIEASTVVTNVDCFGEDTGAIDLTVSGGTPPYTYDWSDDGMEDPDDDDQDLFDLIAATYQVTITDANGCMVVEQATVTQPPALNLSITGVDVLCFGQSTGSADLTVSGGTPPYTYQWNTGATSEDLDNLPAGTYTVVVTDANECTETASVTIEQPDQLVITGTVDDLDCFGDLDGSINVTVTGGTEDYSYEWNTGAITEDLFNLSGGAYSLTVTDANGCMTSATFIVSEPLEIGLSTTQINVDCFGDATGSIDLTVTGGTAPYTYDWDGDGVDDDQDLDNLEAGTYTVVVIDANGCEATTSVTITEPTQLVLDLAETDVLCFGEATGSIDLTITGGTPGYTIQWNTGSTSEDLNNLPAGTYTVVVTDANECSETASVTIEQPTQLNVDAIATDVDCFEGGNGSVNATASGGTEPYTYLWSTGAETEDIFNLVAGTYTVTVTDANGCEATASATVEEPTEISLFTVVTDIECAGEETGAIDLNVSGGTPGYTYLWSNGETTQDLDNLAAGTYTVTVTDANGCTATTSATVNEVNPIMLTGVVTDLICFEDNSGAIDLTVNGGTPGYSYQWSNGATSQDLNGIAAGNYSVTVTDANGCTAQDNFTVEQPDELTLDISAPTITCGGTNSGSIIATPNGGTGPYEFLWSNGATTSSINDLPAGIYDVTVTDDNGCEATATNIQLSEIPELTCEVIVDQEPTMGNNGQLSVDIEGGTAPFTYLWSTGATTPTIDGLSAGTYSVTVTDANNCETTCSTTLEAFAGIGDYVWIDADLDGIQDPDEVGFPDVTVNLKDADGNVIATTTTDADGFYSFMGLEPGTYSVQFITPVDWDYTASNIGPDDALDSDIIPGMNGMTGTYDLDPGEFDMTVDAGLIFIEGAISDPCACLDNATNDADGQFSEQLKITSFSGLDWTIIARENMFVDDPSNDPPAMPELVPLGFVLEEFPIGGGLSEYILDFRIVDELTYTVTVQAGLQTLNISNTCFYPNIFFEDEPPSELCIFDEAFPINVDSDIDGDFTFEIAGQTVTAIDPSTLPEGTYNLVVTLDPFDEDECEAVLSVTFDIANNCPAKLGDFVWNDTNFNGIQDPGEPGIPGVTVTVTSQDGSFTDTQETDANGMYMFMVDPGTYKLTFEQPAGLTPSPQNAGTDDELDSDVDPVMLMTPFYTVGPDGMDLTIDAGFFDECIANIDDPGTIGFDQELCGPGNVPDLLVELTPATGGVGEINYLWMKNTVDPNQPIGFWTPIPNSDSPNLQLGPVYESTYYARCVRRNNCIFLESNSVFIEVGDDANAIIDGPNVVCELSTVTFNAVGADNADNIEWSFTGPANVTNNPDGSVDVFWGSFGLFSVTLSVTENGCTATRNMGVTVITSPASCADGFTASGTISEMESRDVSINWILPMDGSELSFVIERSTDGLDFAAIGTMSEPTEIVNGTDGFYRFDDIAPFTGLIYYRVWVTDAFGNQAVSNVVEMLLTSDDASQLAQVYPNPAVGSMLHVQMLTPQISSNEATVVELYTTTGNLISSQVVPQGSNALDLPLNNQPSGVYMLRVIRGDQVETHQVMVD